MPPGGGIPDCPNENSTCFHPFTLTGCHKTDCSLIYYVSSTARTLAWQFGLHSLPRFGAGPGTQEAVLQKNILG